MKGDFFLILHSAQAAKDDSVFGPRFAKFNKTSSLSNGVYY
jgi:hypothetical protein